MFGKTLLGSSLADSSAQRLSVYRLLVLMIGLSLLLSSCGGPNTPAPQLRAVPGAVAESAVTFYLNKYAAEFQLGPRVEGGTLAIADRYLQRYQPGPEPRAFQSSVVYDRNNRVIAELFDEGRRTWIPLSRTSPYLLDAVVATEDGSFFQNGGIEPRRLVGAIVQSTQGDGAMSGASTITMQLARMMFLPPSERFSRSLERKISEVLLAQDLTKLYSKDEILELYLNMAYFGHLAYGPEAAARTYFGKTASTLTLAEASLLAGLPQQPALLDPFLNLEGAKERQRIVLDLMARRGYISQFEADAAFAQPITLTDDPNNRPQLAPHFLQYLIQYIDRSPQGYNLLRSGLTVNTTLDLDMQNLAQQIVRENVDALRPNYNLNNAALIALKPGTAEILVMVGSADYTNDAIGGQVNVTLRLRQPGSAIKPIVYATAFEKGLISPATLLWDLPVKYPTAVPGQNYRPENYDKRFRGPITVRTALANSLNVPTVKLFDGIEPAEFVATANKLGISNFDPAKLESYGLSTALGGTEVSLYDLTAAYQALANGGRFVEPTPVRQVMTSDGVRVQIPPQRPSGQAVSAETAFLVTDIISDNAARAAVFGENSRLNLSRPAAAKTGTTTNFRDNWTVGFTKYLVAGVWAGNNNGAPMRNADGITGAGPIWNKFMEAVIADPALLSSLNAPADEKEWAFEPPLGVTQVSRPCPPELRCREGGEYFAQSWLERMAAAGPYADSFLSGVMAPVDVQLTNGQNFRPAVCVMRLTPAEDQQARSLLVLPRGVGRLGMEWQSISVAGRTAAASRGVLAALTSARLASVGAITAPIPAPSLSPPQSVQITSTQSSTATNLVTTTVLVDAAAPPILLLDLPYMGTQNQPIRNDSSKLEVESAQRLLLATNDRLRDEQNEVMRWSRNNGRTLVWGDCGHALDWAVAVYGNGVRSVSIGAPLNAPAAVANTSGTQRPVEATPTPEQEVAEAAPTVSGGANGLYGPAYGSAVAGTVTIQGVASLPDFWKWQLDVLVDGQGASFLGVGDQPLSSPGGMLAWNTANYPNGNHVLRLRVVHRDGNYEEYFTSVTVAN